MPWGFNYGMPLMLLLLLLLLFTQLSCWYITPGPNVTIIKPRPTVGKSFCFVSEFQLLTTKTSHSHILNQKRLARYIHDRPWGDKRRLGTWRPYTFCLRGADDGWISGYWINRSHVKWRSIQRVLLIYLCVLMYNLYGCIQWWIDMDSIPLPRTNKTHIKIY